MTYELSRTARLGFNYAHSVAVMDESFSYRHGGAPLSEKDLTHGEWVAKAQLLLTMTQEEDEASTWAQLAYVAACASGAVQAAEELSPASGDEFRDAA